MADSLSKAQRSANMAAVHGRNTKPEMAVRSELFQAGYRFRLHRRDLPGSPDVILPRYRTAVFVHGCFWHGHSCLRAKLPGTNREFWSSKIARNVARDRANVAALKCAGWTVFIVWTCRLRDDLDALLDHLKRCRDAAV
jgi:DNA mismatch endonuclease (patch repair protein)